MTMISRKANTLSPQVAQFKQGKVKIADSVGKNQAAVMKLHKPKVGVEHTSLEIGLLETLDKHSVVSLGRRLTCGAGNIQRGLPKRRARPRKHVSNIFDRCQHRLFSFFSSIKQHIPRESRHFHKVENCSAGGGNDGRCPVATRQRSA